MLYTLAMAPNHSRGAVIMPIEADEQGERWHVSLVGMAGDYPPTDEAGFWEFCAAYLPRAFMRSSSRPNR